MKKETLGQVLKQRREAYALTQRELARKLGVKASHVAYLENGRRRPSLSLLARLAETLVLNKQRLFLLKHTEADEVTRAQPPYCRRSSSFARPRSTSPQSSPFARRRARSRGRDRSRDVPLS